MRVISKDEKAVLKLLLNIAIHLNEFDDKGIYDKSDFGGMILRTFLNEQ